MAKPNFTSTAEATAAIQSAAKQWREDKKRERASRDALASVVAGAVSGGFLNENKVAKLTDIPRMTIRKMLGKS